MPSADGPLPSSTADRLLLPAAPPAVAAEARHRAEILDREVYPGSHHKAAALLCELARNPSLEVRSLLFAAAVTAAYLPACGMPVSPGLDTVLPLARAARDGLPVREVAAQIKTWTS